MQCPRCQVSLESRRFDAIDVDACPGCGGLLLDRGELNKVAEPTGGDLEYSTLHEETFRHDDSFAPIDCPRCPSTPMVKVEFNIHTAIILDYCGSCHGFWLDGPELKRINDEVRRLNDESREMGTPAMMWFARFIWSLPR